MNGRAVFIGHMPGFENEPPEALFNVDMPGNPYHGGTVSAATLKRLGLRDLVDRAGRKLLAVPLPNEMEVSI